MIWVQQKAFTSSLPIFMLSTTHIHACLSGAVSVHSSSPANTFQLSLSLQSMQSLCLKTPLSVQLECSLYKRHPSTSLEWFLFAVHLSSVCHRFFFLILIVSLLPILALQTKHEKHWKWNDMIVFHWNAIKLLMMSSCFLFHCHLLLFYQCLPLQIPGSKMI